LEERDLARKPTRRIFTLILGVIVVVLCCIFVDRPVAWFVSSHRFYPADFLEWPPLVSEWLTDLVVLGMAAVVAWRLWGRAGRYQTLLLAISANLVVTTAIKTVLKGVFGRTGPGIWIFSERLGFADNFCGFHPFHFGGAYQSFPSGHAATTFAVVSILWLSRARWRWLYALVAGVICLALVVLNYHFVSDVIAGAMLGSVTGVYATKVFGLRPIDDICQGLEEAD
jgi:membrane-associated phospholipid phosphatase